MQVNLILFLLSPIVLASLKRGKPDNNEEVAAHGSVQRRAHIRARRDFNQSGNTLDRSKIPDRRALFEDLLPESKGATCTSTTFEQMAGALLAHWDSRRVRGLWLWCMDAGVLYGAENSVIKAVQLFKEAILKGERDLLQDSVDSLIPAMYRIFVAMYLREYRLNQVNVSSDLREAVNSLSPQEVQTLVTTLSPFLGRYEARSEIYNSVTLSQPISVCQVKLMALLHLVPKEQFLSKLDRSSVFADLEVLETLLDFCRLHGIDLDSTWDDLSELEGHMVALCRSKNLATRKQLQEAHQYSKSIPQLYLSFLSFIGRYHPAWGMENIPVVHWELFVSCRPHHAAIVPLPIENIGVFVKPEHKDETNKAIIKSLGNKYGGDKVIKIIMNATGYPPGFVQHLLSLI